MNEETVKRWIMNHAWICSRCGAERNAFNYDKDCAAFKSSASQWSARHIWVHPSVEVSDAD